MKNKIIPLPSFHIALLKTSGLLAFDGCNLNFAPTLFLSLFIHITNGYLAITYLHTTFLTIYEEEYDLPTIGDGVMMLNLDI